MKTRSETTRVGHFRRGFFREKCCLSGSSPTFGGPVREATVKTRKGGFKKPLRELQGALPAVGDTEDQCLAQGWGY